MSQPNKTSWVDDIYRSASTHCLRYYISNMWLLFYLYSHMRLNKSEAIVFDLVKVFRVYYYWIELKYFIRPFLLINSMFNIKSFTWFDDNRLLRMSICKIRCGFRFYLLNIVILKWKKKSSAHLIHYDHVTLSARISLTLSHHHCTDILDPLSPSIASGRSPGLHPVSAQSCCMLVRNGCLAYARPCEGVHWSTSLMSSSLLLQQYPTCLVRLI